MTGITSTGLGSGLDIKTLVTNLVSAEQTPATTRLDTQQAEITTKISSYGNIKSAMSSFQSSLTALTNLSSFQKLTVTSSDTSTVTATASSNADLASYNLEVKQLAKSQTLASTPLSSATSTVGTGTLTIKFGTTTYDPATDIYTGFNQGGSQGTLTLNIDSSNNTLAGISNAINKANAGVTAAVITDNSGSRLVLNSTQTGANNSMEISVTDTGDNNDTDTSGLSALAFNAAATNMIQPQTAQDAKLAINGLDILSSSNTVNTAIKGLALNLQQAQPGKIVNVGISQNNDDITTAINAFVKGYNDLTTIVNPLVTYDATNQKGGLLQGDATIIGSMAQLRSKLGAMVNGLNGSAKSLADIGITTQKDGTLALDSAKLNSQLASNRSGVTSVFAVLGRPSNPNISYSTSTADTKAGQYAIDITQAAAQGVLNGINLPSLTVSAAGNETFKVKVDGVQSGTIALTPKTYASYNDLAAEMQNQINADSLLNGSGVSVGVIYDGTKMVVTSNSSGSSSSVDITEDNTSLGLGVSNGAAGVDATPGVINGTTPTSLDVLPGSDTFQIKVNGTLSGTIALTTGTYASYDALATEMQNKINTDSTIHASGALVSVRYDATPGSEHMVITSLSSGTASQVEIANNSTTNMGLSNGAGTAGTNATKGALTGASQPTSTTVAPTLNTFAIKVDGTQSGTIALTPKTYTSYTELATEIQSRINSDSSIKASGVSVGVIYDGTKMVITSKSYGASSKVEITDNTSSLFSVGAGTPGQDVAGTIGGFAATGKGQALTSTDGNSLGLKLLISDNTAGSKGTVDFSRGLIEDLNKVMTNLLSSTGSITSKTNSFQKSLTDIATARTKLADKMATYQTQLYDKFNRMDALVGQMQSTASYLTQQFAPKSNN
ncbi:flagellar filament capping protein FliD [Methylobacter sp.]|uniref:flagellar filament capping protein FliD n=1 Tax=Methylobacter sp. TaxID=2051955 RepID=UPI002FDE5E4D